MTLVGRRPARHRQDLHLQPHHERGRRAARSGRPLALLPPCRVQTRIAPQDQSRPSGSRRPCRP
eukprot:scaffold235394_cov31-Tisochrysis_lutea.AAC.4